MNNAQSTVEYLVIIGIIITIVLIAVAIFTNFIDFSEPITTMQDKQNWGSGSLAILDGVVDNNGDALFVIQNNLLHPIYFAGYSIDDEIVLVDNPMIFLPQEKKTVFIPDIGECVGNCSYKKVLFHYKITGSNETFDSGGFDLAPGKKNNIYSGTLFFDGPTNSLICIEANNVQECASTQPDLSDYLKLDQTTPQTISNGAPVFDGGLKLNDADKITFGTGNDGTMEYTGSQFDITVNDDIEINAKGQMALKMTGDQYGSAYLYLKNRGGANGAIVEVPNIALVDLCFITSKGATEQINIRVEQRSTELRYSENTKGEVQFLYPKAYQEEWWAYFGAAGCNFNTVMDLSDKKTIDPQNRYLYASNGSTIALNWNNGSLQIYDKLKFTQTDGNEFIDSIDDGYMDYGATTAHRFNAPIHAVHKASDGTAAVADGTYTMGIGSVSNGTITIKDGIITAVTECSNT